MLRTAARRPEALGPRSKIYEQYGLTDATSTARQKLSRFLRPMTWQKWALFADLLTKKKDRVPCINSNLEPKSRTPTQHAGGQL